MPQTPGDKRQTPGRPGRVRKGLAPRVPLSRERIITAAVELLDERGLAGFTMRALGEHLGVEAMAIYHYFPNKQTLLEALGTGVDLAAFFGGYVGLPTDGCSASDLVVELGMRYLQFAHENPAQFTLLFSVLPIDYASWEEFVNGTSTFRIPQSAVEKGIETGEFPSRPGFGVNEMSYALWAFVHGLAMLRHTRLRALEADFDALHRTLLEQLVATFRGGR
ncbi:MAG: TetR/AcrR family transcriptional regulator [Gaiellales bacterium]|nr:TetR/AcrR family transcriptional regulator [Gaiellales bacterium]